MRRGVALALGGSVAAVALGACAVAGLAWLGCAAGGAAGVIAGGIAGNVSDRLASRLLREANQHVAGLQGLPANHDYARGIRTAQMQALHRVVGDFQALHPSADPAFLRACEQFATGQLNLCRGQDPTFDADLTAPLGEALRGLLAPAEHDGPAAQRAAAIATYVEDRVLAELAEAMAGTPIPPAFAAHFRNGQDTQRPRFLDLFGAYVAEQIKDDARFRDILTAGALARIEGLAFDNAEFLHRLEGALGRLATAQEREARRAEARHAEVVALLHREKGIPHATLRALLQRMGEAGVEDAAIEARLASKAEEYLSLRAELERARNDRPDAVAARAAALRLLEEGELDAARAALRGTRGRLRESREQTAREEAGLAEEEARIAKLSLRYREAAALYVEAAALLAFDPEAAWARTVASAIALYDQGNEFGENAALADAIATYGRALTLAPRATRPLDWAMTQNNLGTALHALGERESGTARLEEAVAAYRLALEEWTRERVPLNWATTQNNLGNALSVLGQRESGTARMEEAVAAYRLALEELMRERVPLDWATTQNNLGNALSVLGMRESGTARLEEAVAAYGLALEERTRERVPLDWASTQNNLGIALKVLGERETGTARLEEAVAAYRLALEEWTRERVPLNWATTQNNLGNALSALGERESGTARLGEAVAALRLALEETTRERAPFFWAQTMENLALVHETLAERTGDAALLRTALAECEAALEEYQRAGAEFYIAKATRLRDRLRAKLAP